MKAGGGICEERGGATWTELLSMNFWPVQSLGYLDLRHLRPSGWFVGRIMGMKKLGFKG